MLLKIYNQYKYQIGLLLVILVCYWPFTFFVNALIFDNIDVALPTKYFAGTCLQNGLLPLWNPYQMWGFPAHADLQYTNWNFEVLIIGIICGYDYVVLHILFIFYLFIGSLGMFYLSNHFSKNKQVSFFVALIYVLGGIFISHSQSLVAILGLVFLPFVMLSFFKWLTTPNLKQSAFLSLSVYFLGTMGYQAFVFIIFPFIVILYIQQLLTLYKKQKTREIKQLLIYTSISIVFLCVLFLPIVVTQIQSKPFVPRLNGMSVNEVMGNPFTPMCLISFINPVIVLLNNQWFETDIAMRNIFIGIVPFMFLVLSLFKKQKNTFDYTLLIFAIIYLLGSFGDVTPVRAIMYYVLPGFNLFRFPAILRVAALLCMLCYFSFNYQTVIYLFKSKVSKIIQFCIIGCLSISVIASFLLIENWQLFNNLSYNINNTVLKTSVPELSFYVSVILLILTLISFKQLRKIDNIFSKKIVMLLVIEFLIIISIVGQFNIFSSANPSLIQHNFDKFTKHFPNPSTDVTSYSNYQNTNLYGFWKNTGAFKKQAVIGDEWTSYSFLNYNKLIDSNVFIRDSLSSYPFIYFSNQLQNEQVIVMPIDTSKTFLRQTFHPKKDVGTYSIENYEPTHIVLNCDIKENGSINIQQAYYNGWHASIDNKEVSINWNAGLLMSLPIEIGKHRVEFHYVNNSFTISLIMSLLLACLLIFYYLHKSYMDKKHLRFISILWLMFILFLVFKYFYNAKNQNRKTSNEIVLNNNQPTKKIFDFTNSTDILKAINLLKENNASYSYHWENYYNSPELFYLMNVPPDSIDQYNKDLTGDAKLNSTKTHTSEQTIVFNTTYKNPNVIDTINNALILKADVNQYSEAFTLSTEKKREEIFGKIVLKNTQTSNVLASCILNEKTPTEKALYFPLNKYLVNDTSYQTVPFIFDLKNADLKEIKTAKVFLMNMSNNKVLIKSIEIN